MMLSHHNQVTLSFWLKGELGVATSEIDAADISHMSIELTRSATSSLCVSTESCENPSQYEFIEPKVTQDQYIRNEHYLRQLLIAALIKKPLASQQILSFRKQAISTASAQAVSTVGISTYHRDEISMAMRGPELPAAVRNDDVISSAVINPSLPLAPATMNPEEIDRSLRTPIFRLKNRAQNQPPGKFKFFIISKAESLQSQAAGRFTVDIPSSALNDFYVFSKNDGSVYTIHTYYSLRGRSSISFSEDIRPYRVTADKPALRVSLYHMDGDVIHRILSSFIAKQEKGEAITPTDLLNGLVGVLHETRRFESSCSEPLCGKKQNHYTFKQLILAVVKARIQESSSQDRKRQEWDKAIFDLTSEDVLQQIVTPVRSRRCSIL